MKTFSVSYLGTSSTRAVSRIRALWMISFSDFSVGTGLGSHLPVNLSHETLVRHPTTDFLNKDSTFR